MKIFLGPTKPDNVPADATVLPPAQQGDIAAQALKGPDTLVLIDGLYHQHLAPWHKEMLFALEQGCRVIGAGSIGAIRAVECARYGAEPAGLIAEWYANQTTTDDGDVAVAHTSVEEGSECLSIPIVNLRATLQSLAADGLFRFPEIPGVLDRARAIYYPQRTWRSLKPLFADEEFTLVKESYIDQKKLDAEEAIRLAQSPRGTTASLHVDDVYSAHLLALLGNDLPAGNGKRQHHLATDRNNAIDNTLLADLARLAGVKIQKHDIHAASTAMWTRLGITDPDKAQGWLNQQNLSDEQWYAEAEREAYRQAARDWWAGTNCSYDTVTITRTHQLLKKSHAL